jgi:hypothetical protein
MRLRSVLRCGLPCGLLSGLLSGLLLGTGSGLPAPVQAQQLLSNVGAAAGPLATGAPAAPVLSSRASWPPGAIDPLLGPRSRLSRDWIGLRAVPSTTPILVMAGHADSQNIAGSGTAGEAVALTGAAPMYPGISDELYWNMVIAEAVVAVGRQRGLDIRYHRPPFRTIVDEDEPGTNWTVGREHAAAGGYAMEIHFDAYGPSGVGSGLIPPVHRPFSRIDEALAQEFGSYPMAFRQVLGGPRRGIGLLEIGQLQGTLEASLRDRRTRQQTVMTIANRVVNALEFGLGRNPAPGPLAPSTAQGRRR